MNLLLLSSGTRNKIVQYFKKALNGSGNVICADMSSTAPSLYEADRYYIVPQITDPKYLDTILEICKKEKAGGVLSLIDPELSLLARNRDRFEAVGTTVIGSSFALCEMALDKMQMYRWLNAHGYSCAKCYDNKELFYADLEKGSISFPVIMKPVCGSASIAVAGVEDKEKLELLWKDAKGFMIQEYLNGQEIGADVYTDMISHEVISIFTKKKLSMRAGETDKSVSFKDDRLFELIRKFVKEAGFLGQIDIDLFEVKGEYFILEVNPRFGGGYPHAYESGADHMKHIVNNLEGRVNESVIGKNYEDGTLMMKYNEVMVRRNGAGN